MANSVEQPGNVFKAVVEYISPEKCGKWRIDENISSRIGEASDIEECFIVICKLTHYDPAV